MARAVAPLRETGTDPEAWEREQRGYLQRPMLITGRSWRETHVVRLGALVVGCLLLIPSPSTAEERTTSGSTARRPLRFLVDTPLLAGGETRVRLRNRGDESYVYNSYYQACYMTFRVRSGRRFIIPEGTHCDLVDRPEIAPGETVTLFRWDLDECIEDNWGCTKARDLPPGRYVMKGSFKPADGGDRVRAVRRFRIRRS